MASSLQLPLQPLAPPSHYRILGQIGQGQFGRVYCAVHRTSRRLYALKDLEHQTFPTNKFLRELAYLLTLRHPHIVHCYALEYHATGRYLVMEYCEGGTLRDLMDNGGEVSLNQKLRLIQEILAGLEHAHRKQIIHCDIKPENILLVPNAQGWQAKITDFGIAQLTAITGNPNFGQGYTGSPAYMAPERFYGKFSAASDLYAVGILLYELVVGDRPFSGLPGELQAAHINLRPSLPETIPASLKPIISQALEKLPQKRFASAQAMLEMIALCRQTLAPSPADSHIWVVTPPPPYPVIFSQRDPLAFKVHHLVIVDYKVYLALGNQLSCWHYPTVELQGAYEAQWEIGFNVHILSLQMNKRGINVAGKEINAPKDSSQGRYHFYQFTERDAIKRRIAGPKWSWSAQGFVWGLDPQGAWCACVATYEKSPQQGNMQVIKAPHWQPVSRGDLIPFPSQVLAIDQRHGLRIILLKTATRQASLVQLFNRRGKIIQSVSLGLLLGKFVFNSFSRNHLFGVELGSKSTGIILRLQPLKLTRLALSLEPEFILPFPWGYLLANNAGQILLLDHEGFQVGTFDLPEPITAIAAVGRLGCLVATWQNNQGNLHHLDFGSLLEDKIRELQDQR